MSQTFFARQASQFITKRKNGILKGRTVYFSSLEKTGRCSMIPQEKENRMRMGILDSIIGNNKAVMKLICS